MEFNMNWNLIAPEIFLFIWAILVLFLGLNPKTEQPRSTGLFSLLGLLLVLVLVAITPNGKLFGETFIVDNYARAFKLIFVGAAILTVLGSIDYAAKRLSHRGEFYSLLLLCTTGMMFLASSPLQTTTIF